MKMRLSILSVGLFIMLEAGLSVTLQCRGGGGSFDLRFFHESGLLISVAVSALIFSLINGRLGSSSVNTPLFQSGVYLFILFFVWALVLPLGDQATILWQKIKGTTPQMGAGWFYWNDSGSGNKAMKLSDMLEYIVLVPWWPFLAFFYTWLVFKCKITAEAGGSVDLSEAGRK